jgi:hypothetical protein
LFTFLRLKINHASHEFTLESGTVAYTKIFKAELDFKTAYIGSQKFPLRLSGVKKIGRIDTAKSLTLLPA